jgi:SAM-dependent methyltransferase
MNTRVERSEFGNHYEEWRQKRIQKILNIFGKDYFKQKLILEVGCGYGDIGKYFREKEGANVIFTEGRQEHLPIIADNNPGAQIIHLNHENAWKVEFHDFPDKRFDAIIHFGLLYHLDNWKQDLECALEHSDLIILESEVADSNEKIEHKLIDSNGYDQAISDSRRSTRPSAPYIESVFLENGFSFIRYDDSDLNSFFHTYDWAVTESDKTKSWDQRGYRRFWVAKKETS